MSAAVPETIAPKLAAYLGRKLGTEVAVGAMRRYTVGFSWVTYGFEASWRDASGAHREDLILRMGPSDGLFGPYEAFPQFAALDVLHGSAVPVPRAWWYEEDDAILGAPFFVCSKVDGEAPLPWASEVEGSFSPEVRESIGFQFTDALAALHRFDWRGTKLASLGPKTTERSCADEQIAFWETALERWPLGRYPMLRWGFSWLKAHRPVAPRVTIVHGDYRTGNFLAKDGRITAILDWELVHLGDPHEDLGWVCMRSYRGPSPYMCLLLERDRLYARYEQQSGIAVDPEAVRFYEALGTLKLAIIHIGASHCFETGIHKDVRLAVMGIHVPRLLLQVESTIEGRA